MKTVFEIEIERNNVTPAQFLAYCRRRVDAKGGEYARSELDLDYFKRGDDLNFNINHKALNDECYTKEGCEHEKSISKPYEMQTYIRWANGAVYNEICEFDFDDEKTGHGYYYLVNVNVEAEEETETAQEEATPAEETETAQEEATPAEETETAQEEATPAEETETEEIMDAIRNAMIETGRMSAKCRLECIEISRDGDWMRVGCHLYKTARTKKPHMYWNICVYTPKNQIHWDTSTFYHL